MYSTGNWSLLRITQEMEKLGLIGTSGINHPLSKGMIYTLLNNPFYYGVMRIKGELYEHRYESIISKELYDKCQNVMKGYNKKPYQTVAKPYVFRGLIRCAECGCLITPETSKGHIYYHCTNYKKVHKKVSFLKEETLLEPIYKIFDKIQLTENQIDSLVKNLREISKNENKFNEKSLSILRKRYDAIRIRISNTLDLLVDHSISKEMFDEKLKEYKGIQVELEKEMSRHTCADENFYIMVNTVLHLAKNAGKIFKGSKVEEKRQILKLVLQNFELNKKELVFMVRKPFNTMLKFNESSAWLPFLNEFRTFDWEKIEKEIEILKLKV